MKTTPDVRYRMIVKREYAVIHSGTAITIIPFKTPTPKPKSIEAPIAANASTGPTGTMSNPAQ